MSIPALIPIEKECLISHNENKSKNRTHNINKFFDLTQHSDWYKEDVDRQCIVHPVGKRIPLTYVPTLFVEYSTDEKCILGLPRYQRIYKVPSKIHTLSQSCCVEIPFTTKTTT